MRRDQLRLAARGSEVEVKRAGLEVRARLPDGRIRTAEASSRLIELAGRPQLFTTIHDLTDERRAQADSVAAAAIARAVSDLRARAQRSPSRARPPARRQRGSDRRRVWTPAGVVTRTTSAPRRRAARHVARRSVIARRRVDATAPVSCVETRRASSVT